MEKPAKKILLGMLVANGDCLMATVLAKQIKKDYPGCHLTWAISNLCRGVIDGNPDVDAVWEIQLNNKKEAEKEGWYRFESAALQRKERGEFDEVFFTQIYPNNVHRFDGTTRSTIYNAYPHPVTVDARPVLRLTEEEINKVAEFAATHQLHRYKHVLLFECSSFSGQSFVTPDWALEVSRRLLNVREDLFIILSTHLPMDNLPPRMAVASALSLRENAELTKYCSLLLGCSSGITWIATTDWAKRLPMLQFLKRGKGFTFASVAYDHRYWGLDDQLIIETTNEDISVAVKMVLQVLENGVPAVRKEFHMQLRPRIISLLKYWFMFFRKGKFGKSFQIIRNFRRRNWK
jgi:hypothetical protein